MPDLHDHVALVTGGASGLGRTIARRLASDGARVVITDVQPQAGQETASDLGVAFLVQDVTDEARWDAVVRDVRAEYGGLHILVNNAGMLSPGNADLAGSRVADWKQIFAVNVEGVFLGCRAAVPAITASGGGAIVNISSVAALLATPFAMAYGASKAAVRHLTTSVAQYCVEHGGKVRCNSVHPGVVRTPGWSAGAVRKAENRGVSVDEVIDQARSSIPMGDLTDPEDIAAAVAFLASADARHITGEQLVVDGGLVHCNTYHNTALTGRVVS